MSSVQSFLRQRTPGSTVFQSTAPSNLYVLIAGSGNIVGNYGNSVGYMVLASTAGVPTTAITPAGSLAYIRDMGKTVQAPYSSSLTAPASTAISGFFRQVQVLDNSLSSSQATFGVQGQAPGTFNASNPGDKGYNTFYIPVAVGGVFPVGGAAGSAYLTPPNVTNILGDAL